MRKAVGPGVALIALAAIAFALAMAGRGVLDAPQPTDGDSSADSDLRRTVTAHPAAAGRSPAGRDVSGAPQSPDGATSPDDGPEAAGSQAEEENLVNAFDDLTDRWMKPAAKGVAMTDVDNFVTSFRKIPKARRDECIRRALNLIPDENVMLLVGVLMDKTMDRAIVETVYNDILNRDEDVKKPILQEVFKDKSHPCWADTAWILDVTGELPKSK